MVILTSDPDFAQKQALYAEFLGLPLHIDTHSFCTFAMAHRVHGRQMLTGWPSDAMCLADRDDTRNNMLIETRSSNFLKHDYNNRDYPSLLQLVLSTQVSLELANERLNMSPYNPDLEPRTSTVDYNKEEIY